MRESLIEVQPIGQNVLFKTNFTISKLEVNKKELPETAYDNSEVVGTGEDVKKVKIGDNIIISKMDLPGLIRYRLDIKNNNKSLDKVLKKLDRIITGPTVKNREEVIEYFMIPEMLISGIYKNNE